MKGSLKFFLKNLFQNFFVPKKSISWGRKGENMAERYLRKAGYQTLERNYVNKKGYRVGEIDIIMRDGEEIVFVEVKTRKKRGRFDLPPELAVDKRKLRHLEKGAQRYLRETGNLRRKYRFEIIGIMYDGEGKTEVRHIRHVFE